MGFVSVLGYAQQLIASCVREGDTAVDATVGAGVDTVFLAKLVGHTGSVYGFDIQPEALVRTQARLSRHAEASEAGAGRVHLQLRSHAELLQALPPAEHGKVAGVMFNLGYLPGGDPGVITSISSTLPALEAALALLRPGGILTIVLYPGHPGGRAEADRVEAWAAALPEARGQSLLYRIALSKADKPYLIAIMAH